MGRYHPVPWPERFWAKVDKSGDCWIWTAYRDRSNYGRFAANNRKVPELAARVAVRLSGRTIPDGYQVDHLCRNPPCVRPEHLDVVTPLENIRRRDAALGLGFARTECRRGHSLVGDNVIWRVTRYGRPARRCRACDVDQAHRAYLRRKAAAA